MLYRQAPAAAILSPPPFPKETCGLGSPQKNANAPKRHLSSTPNPVSTRLEPLLSRLLLQDVLQGAAYGGKEEVAGGSNYSNKYVCAGPHAQKATNTKKTLLGPNSMRASKRTGRGARLFISAMSP